MGNLRQKIISEILGEFGGIGGDEIEKAERAADEIINLIEAEREEDCRSHVIDSETRA